MISHKMDKNIGQNSCKFIKNNKIHKYTFKVIVCGDGNVIIIAFIKESLVLS